MSIAFDIPAHLRLLHDAGRIVRTGTLLRDVGTNRIVAHVQEAGGLPRMASVGFDPLRYLGQGVQICQNEQIKAGIAFVQALGFANLALSGLGIGVTIAGVAAIASRIGELERKLDQIGPALEQLGRKIDGIESRLIRQELADLQAELRRVEDAWDLASTDARMDQRRHAANRLLTIEQRFFTHAAAILATGAAPHLRDLMIDAYAIAADGRCRALLAAGEENAAENAARGYAQTLRMLSGKLSAADILREMVTAANPAGLAARAKETERLRPAAAAAALKLREREDIASGIPLTIAALRRVGLSGSDWLQRARDDSAAPFLFLPEPDETCNS